MSGNTSLLKIDLPRDRQFREGYQPEHSDSLRIIRSLPFLFVQKSYKVHRVRYGILHYRDGKYSHTSFHLWCGQTGFLPSTGVRRRVGNQLVAQPTGGSIVCHRCNEKAGQGVRVVAQDPELDSLRKMAERSRFAITLRRSNNRRTHFVVECCGARIGRTASYGETLNLLSFLAVIEMNDKALTYQ
jgi:hypothetical protein